MSKKESAAAEEERKYSMAEAVEIDCTEDIYKNFIPSLVPERDIASYRSILERLEKYPEIFADEIKDVQISIAKIFTTNPP